MKVILLDTPGNERYRSVTIKNIKYSDGCIIVFDVTSRRSFENASIWLDSVKEDYPNFMVILKIYQMYMVAIYKKTPKNSLGASK